MNKEESHSFNMQTSFGRGVGGMNENGNESKSGK